MFRRISKLTSLAATVVLCVLVAIPIELVAADKAFQPRVFKVFDGDRFLARARGRTLRIRIQGVDAPDLNQPHGAESKQILEKMISAKRVRLTDSGTMDGEYRVSRVEWQDYDIGAELVRVGAAWAVPGAENASELMALQKEAQASGRGLWSLADPVPPWDWQGEDSGR